MKEKFVHLKIIQTRSETILLKHGPEAKSGYELLSTVLYYSPRKKSNSRLFMVCNILSDNKGL